MKIFILYMFKRESLPQNSPYGSVHPRYPRSLFELLIQSSSGRPSVSLSNLVLFCGLAIIRLKFNMGCAHPVLNCSARNSYLVLFVRISQKNGAETCINIWPFGDIFGYYGTMSDDSDSAQVRFLRYPQQEGQRSRCSAKHTRS